MGWFSRAFGGDARGPRNLGSEMCSALLSFLDCDLDGAEAALLRAVGDEPDGIDAYQALARLYLARGEVGRAIRVHQNLLLRDDLGKNRRLSLLADLGADFRAGGFEDRAIECFEQVIADDKRAAKPLRALADLYKRSGRYPQAIDCARRLARLEGREGAEEEARLYAELAAAQYAAGEHDEARRSAKRALRRDKRCVAAWLALGDLEAERARPKAALAAWSEVPRADRGSGALVYEKLEATHAALGRIRDFEKLIRDLLDEEPGDAGARRALASVLAGRGEIDAAIAELGRALDANPDDLETRAALGRILLSEGRTAEAAREYGRMIEALRRRGLLGEQEKPQ